MGRFEVRILAAKNLADTQWVGKPDPYCKIRVGKLKYRTKVVSNSLNPIWNERFRFQVADPDTTQVVVEVWNENIFADEMMGTYSLSLNGLEKGVVKDMQCLLSKSKHTTAEVRLRVLAFDFGRPSESGTIALSTALDGDVVELATGRRFQAHQLVPQPNGCAPPGLAAAPPPPAAFFPMPPQAPHGGGFPFLHSSNPHLYQQAAPPPPLQQQQPFGYPPVASSLYSDRPPVQYAYGVPPQ